jgi:hypothetical protein
VLESHILMLLLRVRLLLTLHRGRRSRVVGDILVSADQNRVVCSFLHIFARDVQ